MNATNPLVSIVVPVYNGEKFVQKAVESAIAQTYRPIEVVVVEDGSKDDSAVVCQRLADTYPEVRFVSHAKNQGVSAAWNTGFSAAKGEYMLRLAQDDWLEKEAVAELANLLRQQPELQVAYADHKLYREDKFLSVFTTLGPNQIFHDCNGLGICIMITKQAWDKGLRYDPKVRASEDLDFFIRLHQFCCMKTQVRREMRHCRKSKRARFLRDMLQPISAVGISTQNIICPPATSLRLKIDSGRLGRFWPKASSMPLSTQRCSNRWPLCPLRWYLSAPWVQLNYIGIKDLRHQATLF